MDSIEVISWNINGINLAKKRKHIFHWLGKQNCNVVALQETHIKKSDIKYIVNKRLGEKFCSLTDKKREVRFYLLKKN